MGFTGWGSKCSGLLNLLIWLFKLSSMAECTNIWNRLSAAKHYCQPQRELSEVDLYFNLTNCQGSYKGKWHLSVKSYRSTIGQIPSIQLQAERNICALTMDENVFVLLEDPMAPTRADVLAAAPPGQELAYIQSATHYRTTFLTLSPPGALDHLLTQLKARWVSVRQSSSAPARAPGQAAGGPQLTIEGSIFSIGNDWLVRVGNVIMAGGAVKGMLLEVSD
jgi:hypothetical protein